MRHQEKHQITFLEGRMQRKMWKMKEMTDNKYQFLMSWVRKNNQTLVNLVSSIIDLPSDWDFSVCFGNLLWILFVSSWTEDYLSWEKWLLHELFIKKKRKSPIIHLRCQIFLLIPFLTQL